MSKKRNESKDNDRRINGIETIIVQDIRLNSFMLSSFLLIRVKPLAITPIIFMSRFECDRKS